MNENLSGSVIISICGGAFAVLLGAIGALLVVLYLRNKKKTKESQNWSTTTGRITLSEVRMVTNEGEDISSISFIPKLEYEYEVNGQVFQGKRISFGSIHSFSSRQKAENFLNQFPLSSNIPVYYDPNKPKDAVLRKEMRSMTAGLVIGIILIIVMVCVFSFSLVGLIMSLL